MKMSFKTTGFKVTTVKQLCALVNKIIVETLEFKSLKSVISVNALVPFF